MNKEIVIINKKVNGADNDIEFFSNKKGILFTDENDDLSKKLKEKISKGFDSFIISGGDGTVNHFINSYMKLTKNLRKNLKIGIIPCGRANDLARKLKIPFNMNQAYDITKKDKPKKIDLIQVNEKFFITGGGFGLPAEVIKDVNKHSKKTSNKLLRDLIYYLSVLKKVVINYSGAKIKGINQKLMFFAVCNQNFIGKRFFLSPDSINDDGFFEICHIPKPKNPISGLSVVQKVIKGKHISLRECVTKKIKSLEIELDQKDWFMADGELLEFNDKFKLRIIPKSISIFH